MCSRVHRSKSIAIRDGSLVNWSNKQWKVEILKHAVYMKKSNGRTIEAWPRWKLKSQCSKEELKQANLRTLRNDEVVLDVEDPKQLPQIVKDLMVNEFNFNVWRTGSKGFHIHLKFPELELKEESRRKPNH